MNTLYTIMQIFICGFDIYLFMDFLSNSFQKREFFVKKALLVLNYVLV